jgi:hypothetical protein
MMSPRLISAHARLVPVPVYNHPELMLSKHIQQLITRREYVPRVKISERVQDGVMM